MSAVIDSTQRLRAIDTQGSFCITAPAGSGKTELLIQRFLALLGRVAQPEQILAITFTRKAAAEMRERVLQALRDARDGLPCESEHKQRTQELALQALAADENGGWQLLRDVSRMNIKTIDSFCAGLTRQMPVLSTFGGNTEPQDDASPLYEEAVSELFALLEEDHAITPDLRALLLHFDNNWQRLQELLVEMLGRRDQWRMYLGVHESADESQAYLIKAVEDVVSDQLNQLSILLAPYQIQLTPLLQYAAHNLDQPAADGFPRNDPVDIGRWRVLAGMFLTKKGEWLKSLTKRNGFPADKTQEAMQAKAQGEEILAELQQLPELKERLHGVRSLPQLDAGSHSWELVLHLSRLLPMLAAQLLLVFRRHGVVDHGQVAQAALLALGEDDSPTELALRLDYQIEHILVDEFQDTAINQYELLHKLTRGWGEHNADNPQAPRTLMIVGDAMQSIYGFRSANVGLFLQARQQGVNGVELEHLELQCNFRSDPAVIDWVNEVFGEAFPQVEDIGAAQVSYTPAAAVRDNEVGAAVSLDGFHGEERQSAEAEFVCQEIVEALARGESSIAVLGRQRSHLHPITRRLKELGIAYQAESLDSLAHSPVVADLMTLCRAMASDVDRLAWMALLRAPCCGLDLADLLVVARHGNDSPYQPIRRVITDPALMAALGEGGAARLRHVSRAVAMAASSRDRLGLRVWIERLWMQLGGPRCAPDELSLEDAERFLQFLEVAQGKGLGLDVNWLQRQLDKNFMSGGDPSCPVHVMTLHKAKGLEFDRVFIPRLNGVPRADGNDLLLWDEYAGPQGGRAFLLAANDRSKAEEPTLYNYLKIRRKDKGAFEATRLLYVGATRAAKYLHLSACLRWDDKNDVPRPPPSSSLLSTVWEQVVGQVRLHDAPEPAGITAVGDRPLHRLALESIPLPADLPEEVPVEENRPDRPDNHFERTVGTVIHLALEQLSEQESLPHTESEGDRLRWRQALQCEGLWGEALERAQELVAASVRATLASEEGRWVLSPGHDERRNEWPLTVASPQGKIVDLIIDRCFIDVDTGCRWIVDYKSSKPDENEDWSAFVAREEAHYSGQLRTYREAVRQLGEQPVQCALFFTSSGRLHTMGDFKPAQ